MAKSKCQLHDILVTIRLIDNSLIYKNYILPEFCSYQAIFVIDLLIFQVRSIYAEFSAIFPLGNALNTVSLSAKHLKDIYMSDLMFG